MYDREHKEYLRKIRLNKIKVCLFQLLIVFIFIFLWEYLSRNNIINAFIYSSPSKAINTIYGLYLDGNLFNRILLKYSLCSFSYMIINLFPYHVIIL